MPVPKRRTSKSKSRSRRASNINYEFFTFYLCDECREPKLIHHLCMNCGQYNNHKVIKKNN